MLCTLSLWACTYMLGRAYTCLIFSVGSVDRLSRSVSLVIWWFFFTLVGKLGYSVPLAGFTVIIYFVLYTLVPLVGLLV